MSDLMGGPGAPPMDIADFTTGASKVKAHEDFIITLYKLSVLRKEDQYMLIDSYWPNEWPLARFHG